MRHKLLANYYHQYATMVDAGLSHERALQALSKQGDLTVRRLARRLAAELRHGGSLSDAMEALGEFPPLHLHLIRAGEMSGRLDVVMKRLAVWLERQAAMRSAFIGQLIYPFIVLHVAVLVRVIVMLFTVSTGAAIVAGIKGFAILYGLIVGGWLLVRLLRTLPLTRDVFDAFLLHMPVAAGITRNLGIARFARTCEALYNAGYPLAGAVENGADATGNAVLRHRFRRAVPAIREGTDIATAIRPTHTLSAIQQGMLETGVESGRLDEMLDKIAEQAEFAAEVALGRLGKILPLLFYFIVVIIVVMQIVGMMKGYLDMLNELL